jgi:CBS domain-containing protein
MRDTDTRTRAGDPRSLTVGEIMERQVMTCPPETDALTIAKILSERRIGSLPVVGTDQSLVGLVTEYDLLDAVLDGRDLRKISAAEIMTREVLSVTQETTVEELTKLFRDRHVTRVPVVRARQMIGIVARGDVLAATVKALAYWS